jgi:phage recombination protein Bet
MTQALTLWNNADVALVKSMVADTATPDEFHLLIHLANKYQLDPLAKQIYCIKYGKKPASMFAGLAGFIAIAERSGKYGGVVPEIWREDDPLDVEYTYWEGGQQRKAHYTRAYQWVAKATCWRIGAPHPFVAQVWEQEYSSGQNLWVSKPRTMIQKVAMCQAIRLAFSIGGLYDRAEINDLPDDSVSDAAQATRLIAATGEIIEGTAREVQAEPTPWDAAWKDYTEAAKLGGYETKDAAIVFIREQYPDANGNLPRLKDLTPGQIDKVTQRLRTRANAAA